MSHHPLTRGNRPAHFMTCLALLVPISLGNALPVWAQSDTNQADINQDTPSYHVPAGPLGLALNEFAQQAGIAISFDADLVEGMTSQALMGQVSVQEGMNRLLAGSGLQAMESESGFRVEAMDDGMTATSDHTDPSAFTLDTINITEAVKGSRGTAGNFVPRRSSSATKTDTPLNETPQTINVVTAKQIETLKPTSLSQTLRYTPGVVTEVQPGTTYFDRIRLRGFYATNNLYLDGMQITPPGTLGVAQADPMLLEQVEVLKGPASVLYGQVGPGGLINMVSKRPLAENSTEVGLGIGTHEYIEGTFDINKVSDDSVYSYRVAGVGRRENLNNDYAQTQRFAIAPSLTIKPSSDTSWTLIANLQQDPEGNSAAWFPAEGTVLPNVNGQFPRDVYTCDRKLCDYDRKQAVVTSEFEHQFTDALQFRQNLRYTYVKVDAQYLTQGALQADKRTISRRMSDNVSMTVGISTDNQAKYNFSLGATQNKAIAGFDYRSFSSENLYKIGSDESLDLDLLAPVYGNVTAPTLSTRTDNDVVREQYGVYLQNQMSIDNWRLVGGLRHDWAETETDNKLSNTTTTDDDEALTGRAGLLYLFDNGFAPYISYSTSFEPTSGTDYFGDSFEPTEGKQVELGLKYEPTSFNGTFTLSAYELTETNVTTADDAHTCANAPDLPDCGNYSVQTGEIQVRGIEFEGKVGLADRLNLTAGYTFMDAEITRSNENVVGKAPANAPRHLASAWLDYGAFDNLTVGGGVRYVGEMYADDANTAEIPSYTLFDAKLTFDLGSVVNSLDDVMLSVSATNLTDDDAIGGCFNSRYCEYVPRRSVIASIKAKF